MSNPQDARPSAREVVSALLVDAVAVFALAAQAWGIWQAFGAPWSAIVCGSEVMLAVAVGAYRRAD